MRLTSKERIENCHEDAVWTATWTPADTLISGSVDETVKVWSPGEGNESLHTYTGDHQLQDVSQLPWIHCNALCGVGLSV